MGGRIPTERENAGRQSGLGQPGEIPPYLLSPEGLEAPLPEVTELLPEIPAAPKSRGAPVPPSLRTGPLAHGGPSRHGFDPHGFRQRHAPNVTLREHRVHGRGQ